ncbi:MAG TPA: hypothetical protein DCL80_04580 [Balneola sp.]|mgnify:CR=1 FL=1|jgi:hypothetical protein|nr:hypothetical protein [Balneola sp.]MAO78120.1 hypothetical protein [Balneola sp.]MBF64121.1 hypothetical protein [Balneola sp.]HAH50570.1 hypothetical protein [Balneola sp.]HBZ40233.1 hypothetical protein [Balneola sp.]|tara:strand:+ start:3074 stop:3457 length:384 start_codon:yes stop_codon:yes gene_type:complete
MSDQVLKERIVERPLTEKERSLLIWLVDNGNKEAKSLKHEIENISVYSVCGCGCASIDFAIDGNPVKSNSGMTVVSDFLYDSEKGNQMGCFLFTVDKHLAGIEVYSLGSNEIPDVLPLQQKLYPFKT